MKYISNLRVHIIAFAVRNRGSYLSAHGLLNLLNELRKREKMLGLQASHFISFPQLF